MTFKTETLWHMEAAILERKRMSHDVKLDLKYETFYNIYPINVKEQRETNQTYAYSTSYSFVKSMYHI